MAFWDHVLTAVDPDDRILRQPSDSVAEHLLLRLRSEVADSRIRTVLREASSGPLKLEERRQIVQGLTDLGTDDYADLGSGLGRTGLYLYWLWVWPHDNTWEPLLSKPILPGNLLSVMLQFASEEPGALASPGDSHYLRHSVAHGTWKIDKSGDFQFRDGSEWQYVDPLSLRIKAAVAHLLLRALYQL